MNFKKTNLLFLLFINIFIFISCRKENFTVSSNVKLFFSQDTIVFDTVFASIGTSTQLLLVYNKENKSVKISNIKLARLAQNQYKINIDGEPVDNKKDIIIKAKDSLYIFIQVFIDPNNLNNPYLVKDSLVFETNGNVQDVDLIAYGRNANYYNCTTKLRGLPNLYIINKNTTLDNTKPHIVLGGYLAIDSSATLIINKGTEMYFGPNAGLWISPFATLKVNGTKDQKVIFKGLRTESYFKDQAGQWDRIWLNETYTNVSHEINFAEITNGYVGLQIEPLQAVTGSKVIVKNTIVNNFAGWGVLARASSVDMENCVIANADKNTVACINGGNYNFSHCTLNNNFATTKTRTEPALILNNGLLPLEAYFVNTIIYGSIEKEFALDNSNSNNAFNYLFDHCLIKTNTIITTNNANFNNCILGLPKFKNTAVEKLNLLVEQTSDAKAKATVNPLKSGFLLPALDILEIIRLSPSSIGAYEAEK